MNKNLISSTGYYSDCFSRLFLNVVNQFIIVQDVLDTGYLLNYEKNAHKLYEATLLDIGKR